MGSHRDACSGVLVPEHHCHDRHIVLQGVVWRWLSNIVCACLHTHHQHTHLDGGVLGTGLAKVHQRVHESLCSPRRWVCSAKRHVSVTPATTPVPAVPSPLWLPPLAEAEEEGAEEEAMSCSFRAEVRKLLCTTPNKCSSSDTLSHMPSLCTAQRGLRMHAAG